VNKPFLPGPDADLTALEPFSAIKLIVADLDGTLFPSDLARTAQQLIARLKRLHVLVTIATGRTYTGVQQVLRGLINSKGQPLIGRKTPLILYNGAVVVEAGTGCILFRKTISSLALSAVLKVAARYTSEVFAYTCENQTLNEDNDRFLCERVHGWQFGDEHPLDKQEFNGLPIEWQLEKWTLPAGSPCAILVRSSRSELLIPLADELNAIADISVTRSGTIYLELRPLNSDKSVALRWVAENLGLTSDQVLAVGDNDNDAEMLKWAGIGVAVKTASASAKNHADFISNYGPLSGVIQTLRILCNSRRYYRSARKGTLPI
jgi:Cof subfamily protein (haloacid dehalogenase superfamily)